MSACSSGTKMAMFVRLSERMQLYKAVVITPPSPQYFLQALTSAFWFCFCRYMSGQQLSNSILFFLPESFGVQKETRKLVAKKKYLCQILYFFLACVNQILTCERKRDAFQKAWCDCIFCSIFCSHTHSCFSLFLS